MQPRPSWITDEEDSELIILAQGLVPWAMYQLRTRPDPLGQVYLDVLRWGRVPPPWRSLAGGGASFEHSLEREIRLIHWCQFLIEQAADAGGRVLPGIESISAGAYF